MDKVTSKTYKDAISYLEYTCRLCEVDVDIKFRPEKKNSSLKTNKWTVRVLATNFINKNIVIAIADAMEFIIKAFPEKFAK